MISLQDKRIFISAASAGMGQALARQALAAGAEVCATDIDEAGLAPLAELGAEIQRLDVTSQPY